MSNKVRSMAKARARMQAKNDEIAVSLFQLLNSNSLSVLMLQDMSIQQSFRIGKIVRGVNAEIEQYNATRTILCEKHAEKDGEGKAIKIAATETEPERYDIPKNRVSDFDKEHQELLATEVLLAGAKIKVGDLDGVKIAPAHLINLDWLIEE